ncbi:hypothetical protein ANCCEY_01744 [Ancylostoma ceylanicum]|uniref:Uncharacterized protein n=1 Tax=Ancylostoma ceylanicum TaxID=53326 RepID=A0A0D6MCN4_9BILA|nr:hypothetical protein ANCCEY_01744 [Ancylostoma ceylanicum]
MHQLTERKIYVFTAVPFQKDVITEIFINDHTYIPKNSRVDPSELKDSERRHLKGRGCKAYSRMIVRGTVYSSRDYCRESLKSHRCLRYKDVTVSSRKRSEATLSSVDTYTDFEIFEPLSTLSHDISSNILEFERKPEVLAERGCNFSPSNNQAVRRTDQHWEREPLRNDAQCEDMFEEELFDAEMHPVPTSSLYDCIRNGVFLVNEAARHLDDLQQANKFSEAAFNPGKMTVANLREVWQLEETPPLRKVNLGDLAHDWKERTQDNDNQKLTSLFRYILKNTIDVMSITLHTAAGDIKVELFCQECPKTR